MGRPKKEVATAVAVSAKSNVSKVVVYTPEQREEALKLKVSTEVQKLPVVDKKLAELKEKFKDVKIDGIDDKKGLATVKAGLSELTSYRTATEAKAGELSQDYKDIVKGINGEAKRIIDEIKEIEEPLRAEKKRIEQEQELAKQKAEQEAQKKIDDRVTALKEAGLSWDGSFYTLGTITIDLVTIKKLGDDKFILLCSKAKDESNRLEEERKEEERIREEEREKAKKQAEEQEKERLRLDEERKELQKQAKEQQAEIDKMKADAEKAKKEMQAQREAQEREMAELKRQAEEQAQKLEREKIEAKAQLIGYRLVAIGMRRVGDRYDYFDDVIKLGANYDITKAGDLKDEDDIIALVSTLENDIKNIQDKRSAHDVDIEKKRLEALEIAKKEKDLLEAEKEAFRLATMPDVDKVSLFITNLTNACLSVDHTEIKNDQISKHVGSAMIKISGILVELKQSIEIFTK